MPKKPKFIAGIDEAGRGPLAGPVSVGCVLLNPKFLPVRQAGEIRSTKQIKIKDSKKLNAKQREESYKFLKKNFECHCVLVSHKMIDKIGIARAIALGVEKVLAKLSHKPDLVMLDGSLRAPKEYNQKTIIKGDDKIPVISAGSIIAKVTRDRYMMRLHKKLPQYDFAQHKGYGTALHYKKIKQHGISDHHRRSFLKGVK